VNELCGTFEIEKQYKLLKMAQRYSVNLFPNEFEVMTKKHAIQEVQEGSGIFHLNDQYYSHQFGWCDEIVNEMKTLIY
jgi:CRISPR-associated endonuclease/helicase Cas3